MKKFLLIILISIYSLGANDIKIGDESRVNENNKKVISKNPRNIIINGNIQRYNMECFIPRASKITILAKQDDSYLVKYSALKDSKGYGSNCFDGTVFFMKKKDWIPLSLVKEKLKLQKEKDNLELLKEINRLEVKAELDKNIESVVLSIIKDFKEGRSIPFLKLNISNKDWVLFYEIPTHYAGYYNTYFVKPFSDKTKLENFDEDNRENFVRYNEHYSLYNVGKYILEEKIKNKGKQ